jgi:hypothetical protein
LTPAKQYFMTREALVLAMPQGFEAAVLAPFTAALTQAPTQAPTQALAPAGGR